MKRLKDSGWAVWCNGLVLTAVWPFRKNAIAQLTNHQPENWPWLQKSGFRLLRTTATASAKARKR